MRGPSRILDTARSRSPPGPELSLDELVLYELHVGTFSPEGTFDGVVPRLAGLRELGVTAIELMPVATFPGNRGWGYDGLYTFAPHPAYGGPAGLARLVDAAHREGLGVVLDVVYNHIGPGNEALRAFGPYFTDRFGETPWGQALDYSQAGVREWAIQNAELWVRDYGIDGLRLDAVHAVEDDSDRHVLAELADRVRAASPRALVISEMGPPDFRPLREWGHDAMWLDGLHHALHVALTGEQDGYYADFDGSMESIAARAAPAGGRPHRRVRPEPRPGRQPRARRPAARREAARRGGRRPLQPVHAAALPGRGVRRDARRSSSSPTTSTRSSPTPPAQGRRREFAHFAGFCGEVPDPQDEAAFERSKLTPREPEELVRASCCGCGASCRASSRSRLDEERAHARCSGAAARRCAPTSPTRRSSSTREGLARQAVPARPALGRRRHQLLPLLRARRRRSSSASSTSRTARRATS